MSMEKKERNSWVADVSACKPMCESAISMVSSANAWPCELVVGVMRHAWGMVLRCRSSPLMKALNLKQEKGSPCLQPLPIGVSGVLPYCVSTVNVQSLSMSAISVTI